MGVWRFDVRKNGSWMGVLLCSYVLPKLKKSTEIGCEVNEGEDFHWHAAAAIRRAAAMALHWMKKQLAIDTKLRGEGREE